jgi:hypothetical protein
MTQTNDIGGRDVTWRATIVKRRSAPPLRFQGRHLARHTSGRSDTDVTIDLWRRKTPGYVVAITSARTANGASVATLDQAMSWLEMECAAPVTAIDPADETSLADMIDEAGRGLATQRALRWLAGEAMDHWDRMNDPLSDYPERETT